MRRRWKPDPNQLGLPGSDRWGTAAAQRSFIECVRHHMADLETEFGLKLTAFREGTYESAEYVNEHVRLVFTHEPGEWHCALTIDRQNRMLRPALRTLPLSAFAPFESELEDLALGGDQDGIAFLFVDVLRRQAAGPLSGEFDEAWKRLAGDE